MRLDHSARVLWSPIVDSGGKPMASGGQRDFETLKNAVRFVMEDLAGLDRMSAFIQTDESDGHYPIEKIKEIYESKEFRAVIG